MATIIRLTNARPFRLALAAFLSLLTARTTAQANLFMLSAGGTISTNSSGDPTLAVGTPWTFELTYDTGAPDLDFELKGSPDPSFGRFTNAAVPPAVTFFHYQAGSYEVTISDPAGFVAGSEILITFTSVNAIDINLFAPTLFPSVAGVPVSFHADFNAFSSAPIFTSDGLPTNTALGPGNFDQSIVSLLPLSRGEVSGSVTSLTLTSVPEPGTPGLAIAGLFLALGTVAGRTRSKLTNGNREFATTLFPATF